MNLAWLGPEIGGHAGYSCATRMVLGPGDHLGSYEVLELLGVGGTAEVYRVRDPRLQRDVAVKVLLQEHHHDPDRRSRLAREARICAALNHPNIATIHGVEEIGGTTAIVMELVEGQALDDMLALARAKAPGGGLAIGTALPIARQIVDALEAAHERGIIHRDLKPANVTVRTDGIVKVLDLGLAKALRPDPSDAGRSKLRTVTHEQGRILGTPSYMSPEQARGLAVDRRTDIWAFGCVLYEMLTGRRAFDGATGSDVIARVLEREPDWTVLPADTPPAVRRLLERCLEKDPKRRLRDIADARTDLHDAGGVAPESVGAPARQGPRPRLAAWALAALVVLAGTAGGLILLTSSQTRADARELNSPAGTAFGAGVLDRTPAFSISPDGQRLAFVAATIGSGHRQIWIRAVGSLEARPLPGTDNVSPSSPPFWSPNGASVGFFADCKLKTVAVSGGVPKTLADAGNGAGGTWNRDDVIVFAPNTMSGLLRIPAAGGQPAPVTTLQSGDAGHVFPQFLPDGRHVQYLVRAAPPRQGIYVSSLAGGEPVFVMPSRLKALVTPQGQLIFPLDGRLMMRAFDLRTYQFPGDARPLADSVAFIWTDGRASFDVSQTGTLAYRASGIQATSQPIWVDRSNRVVGTAGDAGDYQAVYLSRDRSRLAVELHDLATGTGDLKIVDMRRGGTTTFTSDGMHNTRPVWSPDDSEIVFTGRPYGVRNLHLKRVGGADEDEPLLPPGPDRVPTDWSRDGSRILYDEHTGACGGNSDLWWLDLPARTPRAFLRTPFNEHGAQLSPDQKWVAYVSNEEGGRDEVYVRSFPDGDNLVRISLNGGQAPRWSEDGSEIFFVRGNEAVVAVSVGAAAGRLVPGTPQVLFRRSMRSGGVTPDAWFVVDRDRFLIVPAPSAPLPGPPITVVDGQLAP